MIKKFIINHFNNLWMEYKVLKSKSTLKGVEKKDKKIFIFLAADYRNMGDVAITYAQKLFLNDTFPEYKVIEIPADKTLDYIKNVKSIINKDDIITTIGGGNMGDMYEYYENLRRLVFKKFKKQFTISFPQTIDFSQTSSGKKSLKKTKKAIKKHKKILILAREKKSYKKMQEYFENNKIMLVPDIVLYLKNKIDIHSEKIIDVGICFRDDKEEDNNYSNQIDNILKAADSNNYYKFDTCINDKDFSYEQRYSLLDNILKKIASCKLIYTNRLHAMIFSYLVNTKCFFIDNSNKKISETYNQWLVNSIFINPLTGYSENKESEIKKTDYSEEKIKKTFEKLKEDISLLKKEYNC